MYRLACKDLGMDCTYVAKGFSADEVQQKAMAHAGKVHSAVLQIMSPRQMAEMQQTINRATKQVKRPKRNAQAAGWGSGWSAWLIWLCF